MPEDRDYDLAVYKVPRKGRDGRDITGDKIGAGGRHREDGTYSGVAYDPKLLDEEGERRLSGPVRYEDLSPVGQVIVDGFEIAFTRLMDYASERILVGFDNWLYNRRRKKEKEQRPKTKAIPQKERPLATKAERLLQEKAVAESISMTAQSATTIILPNEFDAAYEQYSICMTSEEAQKELLDAFVLYVLAVKKINRVAHSTVTDSAGNITDGKSAINKISAPVVIEKINEILTRNSGLLEEWQVMALSSILGRTVIEGTNFVPIDRVELQKCLLTQNQADSHL